MQRFSPKFLLIAVVTLWMGAAPALAPASPKVLVHGDSLSAAYNMSIADGWVALLDSQLAKQSPPWSVINSSVSGETTSGGLARLPALLAHHQPQIVVLELGANDGLRGLDPAAMQSNLATMIELSQASGAQVLLIGIQLPPNFGQLYNAEFERVFRALSAEYQVPLIPSLLKPIETERDAFQADQLHPTAAVQGRLMEPVREALIELIVVVTAGVGGPTLAPAPHTH